MQLNPAIAHFKGTVKFMLYSEVSIIANIKKILKILLGIKICVLYWLNYVISGCAIAGFHGSIDKLLYCTGKTLVVDNLV